MNLDQVSVEIRPRRPWEAVDLGLRMAQRWWLPLIKIWILASLPICLLLYLLPKDWVFFQLLILWLILPLFERLQLHFLSHAVFNQMLTTAEVFRELPRLWFTQLFSSLIWRRFSFTRSMDMPVSMLEGLSGSRRSSRLTVLHREDTAPASWLTCFFFLNTLFIAAAFFVLGYFFLSNENNLNWWSFVNIYLFSEGSYSGWLILNTLIYLAWSIVTPFYVAGGFALYLNRRIRLEAWDVEIAFRRIVQKRHKDESSEINPPLENKKAKNIVSIVLFFLCVFGAGHTENTLAGDFNADSKSAEVQEMDAKSHSKYIVEKILNSEDFNKKEIIKVEKPKEKKQSVSESSEFWDGFFRFLHGLIGNLAKIGEVLLWVLVVSLVVYVLYRYRHWFAEIAPERSRLKASRPDTLFGLQVNKESLPEDVSAEAMRLLQENKYRESLALLYRACLAQLVDRGLELHNGETELECLALIGKHAEKLRVHADMLRYFNGLTEHWRRLAYGHILPDKTEAQALCENWLGVWQGTTAE